LWSFLSTAAADLDRYVLFLFRNDFGSDGIYTADEFNSLLGQVMGRDISRDTTTQELLKTLWGKAKDDDSKEIVTKSEADILRWLHNHSMLLNSVVMVHVNLRKELLGESLWDILCIRRYEEESMIDPYFIMNVTADSIILYKRLKEEAANNSVKLKNTDFAKRRRSNLARAFDDILSAAHIHKAHPHPLVLPLEQRERRSIIRPDLTLHDENSTFRKTSVKMVMDAANAVQNAVRKHGTGESGNRRKTRHSIYNDANKYSSTNLKAKSSASVYPETVKVVSDRSMPPPSDEEIPPPKRRKGKKGDPSPEMVEVMDVYDIDPKTAENRHRHRKSSYGSNDGNSPSPSPRTSEVERQNTPPKGNRAELARKAKAAAIAKEKEINPDWNSWKEAHKELYK
jgi:hypothetical protein